MSTGALVSYEGVNSQERVAGAGQGGGCGEGEWVTETCDQEWPSGQARGEALPAACLARASCAPLELGFCAF